MNQFLMNNLFAIILFLLLIILLLIGVLVFFVYKMLVQQNSTQSPEAPSSKIAEATLKLKPVTSAPVVESFFCIHHLDRPSCGSCLICEEVFCEKCLVEHESMHFCKEHFRLFANHKWRQITDLKTTPNNPDEGLYIYEFKREIWASRNIPTFVMTHYKINTDNDYIESFIQLNVREEDVEKLSLEIEKHKARH